MFTSGRKESLYPHQMLNLFVIHSWIEVFKYEPCISQTTLAKWPCTCFAPGFGEMHFADGFGEMHATSPPMQNEPSPFERDLDGELVCKTNPSEQFALIFIKTQFIGR